MRVPNAWPARPDKASRMRIKGPSLRIAVERIVSEAGARAPYKGQHSCFEVVAFVKRNSDRPMPSVDEFEKQFDEYLEEVHGESRIAARYIHTDESGLHAHAIAVPLTKGRPRGRYASKAKPRTVNSWAIYSGSEGRRHKGLNHFRNPTMAAWQTLWAARWQPLGFRRGIASSREHTPIKRFQGQAATISAMADEALQKAIASIALPDLPAKEVPKLFTKAGRAEIEAEIRAATREMFQESSAYLRELALRGLQLDAERSSRINLEKRALAAEAKSSQMQKSAETAMAQACSLETKLKASKGRHEALEASLRSREFIHTLPAEELENLILQAQSELEERTSQKRYVRPGLSEPNVPLNPKGHEPAR